MWAEEYDNRNWLAVRKNGMKAMRGSWSKTGQSVLLMMKKGLSICLMVFVCIAVDLSINVNDVEASVQSRRVVIDPNSGLAIWGYDPVAYHTDQKAVKGKHDYEFVWNNVSWVFASQANLEVFKADPDLYAPQFGGHGALAMARGYLSASNPKVWALYKDRLYLFYSFPARAAWAQALEQHIQRGIASWQKLEPTLTR